MDLDREIQALVSRFTDDVAALFVAAARDALSNAFGNTKTASSGMTRSKGAKRDADQLGGIRDKLLATVQANPGKRIEEVGKALGLRTKELALPLRQLLASGVITKRGKKRGTTYHPNV